MGGAKSASGTNVAKFAYVNLDESMDSEIIISKEQDEHMFWKDGVDDSVGS